MKVLVVSWLSLTQCIEFLGHSVITAEKSCNLVKVNKKIHYANQR